MSARILTFAVVMAALLPVSALGAQKGAHIAMSCAFAADPFCNRLLAELQAAGHQVDKLPDGADLAAELEAPGAVVQVRQAPWEVVVLVRREGVLETRIYKPDSKEANPAQLVAVQVAEGLRATFEPRASEPQPEPAPAPQEPAKPAELKAPAATSTARAVRFDASGDALVVSVDRASSCVTPCELQLEPGTHRVQVVGRDEEEVVLPDSATLVRVSSRSKTRLALGITGLGVGVPIAAAGFFFAGVSATSPGQDTSQLIAMGVVAGFVGICVAALGGVSLGLMGRDAIGVESAGSRLVSPNVDVNPAGAGAWATFTF